MSLDDSSLLPKYHLLKEAIKRDALRSGLTSGDAIPSERELGKIHDVSRVTVRRAIKDLVAEGFLRPDGRRCTVVNDPSRAAPERSRSERRLVGVLISRIQTSFSDPLLRGIDNYCHELGYSLVFGATDEEPARAARQIDRMAGEGVAGFILVPLAGSDYRQANTELFARVRERGLPLVLLDRYIRGSGADTVVSDNFDGAYRATRHLIDQGHRRIAYVGYLACSAVEDRLAGYEKCLMDNGIAPDDRIVASPRPEEVRRTVTSMMKRNPDVTAIFAVNDAKAMVVWESLIEMGLSVPGQVALVGYDNLYGSSGPGALLTTTEQPLKDEGELACKMLIERVQGYQGEPRFAVLKSRFVAGQSSCRNSPALRLDPPREAPVPVVG